MGFTEHHVQHYREHGYAIAENFLSQTELNRAREEIDSFIPGWLEYADSPHGANRRVERIPRSRRTMRFPFKGSIEFDYAAA